MASGKEIRTKINTVKSTQKITSAMEMVAASKMKQAQERMFAARPYSEKIAEVVSHIAHANPQYKHPLMQVGEPSNHCQAIVVVSSDRGLCGGLNNNLFRKVLQMIDKAQKKGDEVDIFCVGQKAVNFFKRFKEIKASVTQLGDKPSSTELIGLVQGAIDGFIDKEYNSVFLAYNHFVNTMSQDQKLNQLLPLPAELSKPQREVSWDYLYEPDAPEVLDVLLNRYVESVAYQSVLENIACEQAQRMISMKSATDNAGEMINKLQLSYNKARQAMITQELAEICSGAAAV